MLRDCQFHSLILHFAFQGTFCPEAERFLKIPKKVFIMIKMFMQKWLNQKPQSSTKEQKSVLME